MKMIARAVLAAVFTLSATSAFADHGHEDHRDFHPHPEWHKGAAIGHDDWSRGRHVDYHEHHLRRPPRGYEWREVDGNYVLAAAATGVIASIIANGG
jgi:Ni/Co efflux regulator RcnB